MLEDDCFFEISRIEFDISIHGRSDNVLRLLHLADVCDEGLMLLQSTYGGEV